VGYLIPLIYLIWSLKYGALAPENPWNATGLEWRTQSPPITQNFEKTPLVAEEAYDYAAREEVALV
jgi:cytochrome c oxidase subunit 1